MAWLIRFTFALTFMFIVGLVIAMPMVTWMMMLSCEFDADIDVHLCDDRSMELMTGAQYDVGADDD